jgi:hypothetical protein
MDSLDVAARDLVEKLKDLRVRGFSILGLDSELADLVKRVEGLLPKNR